MGGDSRGIDPTECKAPALPKRWEWVGTVAADALLTADLVGALYRAGRRNLLDWHRARSQCPEADALAAEVDQLVSLRALESIRAAAAGGNLSALKALADGTVSRLLGDDGEGRDYAVICPNCWHYFGVRTRHGTHWWVAQDEIRRPGKPKRKDDE